MRQKLIGLLVATGLMFSLVACEVTDPAGTMQAPVVVEKEGENVIKDVLTQVRGVMPEDIELLKITGLTEQKNDWLEADLTGDGEPEILLGYRDKDEKVGVIILQKDEQEFKKLYMQTFDNEDYQMSFDKVMEIKTAQLLDNKLPQLVISYDFYGADHNSLSVHVLGYDPAEKVVKNYFSLQDLPKAQLEVQSDRIMIKAMGISKEYKWDGSKFSSKQVYNKPEVKEDDVVIHYAMSKRGPLTVSKEEVTLKVGQRLVLIRDDQLEKAERIMQGGDDPSFVDILDFTADNVYTAQKAGTVHLTIVPNGGYDWDNAQEITVNVE